jgi:hypothetical protein
MCGDRLLGRPPPEVRALTTGRPPADGGPSGPPDDAGPGANHGPRGTRLDVRAVAALSAALTGPEPTQVPARLCAVCADLLPVSGASVSLSGGDASRALWWSSDRTAGQLAEAQYTFGDGPCQRALDLVAPVLAADLTRGADARRWPVFAQYAVGLGVRAVYSFPLGSESSAVGTLDLYSSRTGPLDDRDLRVALIAADAITYALQVLHTAPGDAETADDAGSGAWLLAAESDHEEVHQATGMVMVQRDLGYDQALALLRARAFASGRTVSEVSRDVVERKVRLDD